MHPDIIAFDTVMPFTPRLMYDWIVERERSVIDGSSSSSGGYLLSFRETDEIIAVQFHVRTFHSIFPVPH